MTEQQNRLQKNAFTSHRVFFRLVMLLKKHQKKTVKKKKTGAGG
jgi:hypothetical protein